MPLLDQLAVVVLLAAEALRAVGCWARVRVVQVGCRAVVVIMAVWAKAESVRVDH